MRSHATNPSRAETTTARIEWPMNDHRAMTVRIEGTDEVRHLVEFADESVAETLSRLPTGATVPLRMESLGARGNAWRVTDLIGLHPDARTGVSRSDDVSDHEHGSEEKYGETRERAEV